MQIPRETPADAYFITFERKSPIAFNETWMELAVKKKLRLLIFLSVAVSSFPRTVWVVETRKSRLNCL